MVLVARGYFSKKKKENNNKTTRCLPGCEIKHAQTNKKKKKIDLYTKFEPSAKFALDLFYTHWRARQITKHGIK